MKAKLTKIDVKNNTVFIGIDVHQRTWYVTIIYGEFRKSFCISSDAKILVNYLNKIFVNAKYLAGYEAGCFGFAPYEKLIAEGISVKVLPPSLIPTSLKDKKNKSDKADSLRIANTIRDGYVAGIYVPTSVEQEHRELVRYRDTLSKDKARLKNQIKSLLRKFGVAYPEKYSDNKKHWSNNFVKWLSSLRFKTESCNLVMKKQIDRLEFIKKQYLEVLREIRQLSRTAVYKEIIALIQSTPGVGLVCSMTVVTEIVDFTRFKNFDCLASYSGLSPTEHSSGDKRIIGHLNRRCNNRLRKVLIEAAWVAIRCDKELRSFYDKQIGERKKPKGEAIVKVAIRLLASIRHIVLHNEPYVSGVTAA